jgi:hypothetical protein
MTDLPVRIVREIVHEYADHATAAQDMAGWQLGGVTPNAQQFGPHKRATSRIVESNYEPRRAIAEAKRQGTPDAARTAAAVAAELEHAAGVSIPHRFVAGLDVDPSALPSTAPPSTAPEPDNAAAGQDQPTSTSAVEGTGFPAFTATVIDAGGMHVDLLVDPDTMQYPTNTKVAVVPIRPTTTWIGALELADGSLMHRTEMVLPLGRDIAPYIDEMHHTVDGPFRTNVDWPEHARARLAQIGRDADQFTAAWKASGAPTRTPATEAQEDWGAVRIDSQSVDRIVQRIAEALYPQRWVTTTDTQPTDQQIASWRITANRVWTTPRITLDTVLDGTDEDWRACTNETVHYLVADVAPNQIGAAIRRLGDLLDTDPLLQLVSLHRSGYDIDDNDHTIENLTAVLTRTTLATADAPPVSQASKWISHDGTVIESSRPLEVFEMSLIKAVHRKVGTDRGRLDDGTTWTIRPTQPDTPTDQGGYPSPPRTPSASVRGLRGAPESNESPAGDPSTTTEVLP